MVQHPTPDDRLVDVANALDAHQRARKDSPDHRKLKDAQALLNDAVHDAVQDSIDADIVDEYEREPKPTG